VNHGGEREKMRQSGVHVSSSKAYERYFTILNIVPEANGLTWEKT
jgi:hypothetical protein